MAISCIAVGGCGTQDARHTLEDPGPYGAALSMGAMLSMGVSIIIAWPDVM